MARDDRHVKSDCAGGNVRFGQRCVNALIDFVEHHPRTGWYIAILATLNFFLNLIDAFDFF